MMRRRGSLEEDTATTVSALLETAVTSLAASGSARLDAEVLLQHVLDVDRAWFYAHPENELADASRFDFHALVNRRREGFPVAYLVGFREFWSMPLQVNSHTLIPRPETENLVETCLALMPDSPGTRVLDLGTGSGAIALALARERPDWRITAADVSAEALDIARENARRLDLAAIEFVQSDWFSALGNRRFDLIICNPPYVASGDSSLVSGDSRFEPRLALDGGHGGLEALGIVIAAATRYLEYGGHLLLEHGHAQGDSVRRLLATSGYAEISTSRDTAGLERVSRGRWS